MTRAGMEAAGDGAWPASRQSAVRGPAAGGGGGAVAVAAGAAGTAPPGPVSPVSSLLSPVSSILDDLGFPVPSVHTGAFHLSRASAAADASLWNERWCAAVRAGAWGAPLPSWLQALGRSRFARVSAEARPYLWMVVSGAEEMRRAAPRDYGVLCAEAEGDHSHAPAPVHSHPPSHPPARPHGRSHPSESSQLQVARGGVAGLAPGRGCACRQTAGDVATPDTPPVFPPPPPDAPPPPPVFPHRLRPADAKQIDADLPRTFPSHPLFRSPGPAPAALRRILRAHALFNPSVGYCQSLNFVAAVLFLVAGEEPAFWILAAVCARTLPDYHTHTMAGLRIDTAAFGTVVAAALPELHSHLESIEVRGQHMGLGLGLGSRWHLSRYI